MNLHRSIFITLIIVIAFWSNLSAQRIRVTANQKNPRYKENYKLIFEDEFEGRTLNLQKWDPSSSNPQDDVPCEKYQYAFMHKQIELKNGSCYLHTDKATQENSNCPLAEDCESGVSAEIKTASYRDLDCQWPDLPNVCFQNYFFPDESYIEIRARTTNPECNAGCSFWLYTPDGQEIDVFETTKKQNYFTSGLWGIRRIKGKHYTMYENYQSDWRKFWKQRALMPKIVEFDSKLKFENKSENLSNSFVTYAVEFTAREIKFYVNNILTHQYHVDRYNNKNRSLMPISPKSIRLSSGQITGSDHKPCVIPCSSAMEIDYVRVYYPDQKNAIQWLDSKSIMLAENTETLSASYIADVEYKWSSEDVDFFPVNSNSSAAQQKIKLKNQTASIIRINLKCTFPDGTVENLSRVIEVQKSGMTKRAHGFNVDVNSGWCFINSIQEPKPIVCDEDIVSEFTFHPQKTWVKMRQELNFKVPEKENQIYLRKKCGHQIIFLDSFILKPNPFTTNK
ncbi:MAG TPA: glycoside hydrolase family 16 protein [Saprospiraceae bacterium]|nr:glycoside hydrolase family 16 protein [Saprospiraceae bacterium]